MGIYNGPSIYNQGGVGGGGGGYHDGGQIVDADFMEVENNAVSSYDNTSRDPINFYFEPAEAEIINAVVELTTAVNSTVNVYVLRNGFYYLLGNVGGDTVTAGNDYKVNITGDSYAIEQVNGGGVDPSAVLIGSNIYGLIKVGSTLWTTSDLREDGFISAKNSDRFYYAEQDININGWHLPNDSQFNELITTYSFQQLKDTIGWNTGLEGNNQSGFSLKGNSYLVNGSILQNYGRNFKLMGNQNGYINCLYGYDNTIVGYGMSVGTDYVCVRLVKEV